MRLWKALLWACVVGRAWAQISVSPTSVDFGSFVQGQSVPAQTLTITATEPWRATPGANWLSATPQTGQASANAATVALSVVTANLPVKEAQQTTTVVISSTAATTSPAAPVTVTVTITFKPVLSVSRTSFSFNALPGQTPPVESFGITTNDLNNAGWTITPAVTTPKGGTWLGVSTRAGSGSLDTVIVLVNTSGLPVGSYAGSITVTPGAPGTATLIPVTLVITSGPPNVALSSPYFAAGPALVFAGVAPGAQNFTLINTGGNQFSWSLAVGTSAGGNWLLVSPKSGTAASTITVAVNGVGLSAGAYSGIITVTVPGAVIPTLTVGVTYTISPTTPMIASSGVVNAATFLNGSVSPGQLITIFGSNLSNGVAAAVPTGNALPTILGVTSVTMDGFPCPLIYVSPTQINAQAPFEIQGPTTQVIVKLGDVASQAAVVNVDAVSPAMFSIDGTGQGSATILKASDYTLVTATNPAKRGDVLAIYCTGLGQVEGGGITGMLVTGPAAATAVVTVNFGTTAASVRYAGLAVGFVGLYQINVVVPTVSGGTGGTVPVTIKIGNVTSAALNTFIAAQGR